ASAPSGSGSQPRRLPGFQFQGGALASVGREPAGGQLAPQSAPQTAAGASLGQPRAPTPRKTIQRSWTLRNTRPPPSQSRRRADAAQGGRKERAGLHPARA